MAPKRPVYVLSMDWLFTMLPPRQRVLLQDGSDHGTNSNKTVDVHLGTAASDGNAVSINASRLDGNVGASRAATGCLGRDRNGRGAGRAIWLGHMRSCRHGNDIRRAGAAGWDGNRLLALGDSGGESGVSRRCGSVAGLLGRLGLLSRLGLVGWLRLLSRLRLLGGLGFLGRLGLLGRSRLRCSGCRLVVAGRQGRLRRRSVEQGNLLLAALDETRSNNAASLVPLGKFLLSHLGRVLAVVEALEKSRVGKVAAANVEDEAHERTVLVGVESNVVVDVGGNAALTALLSALVVDNVRTMERVAYLQVGLKKLLGVRLGNGNGVVDFGTVLLLAGVTVTNVLGTIAIII